MIIVKKSVKKSILIYSLIILIAIGIAHMTFYEKIKFVWLKSDRENVVNLIKNSEITVQPNGCVVLPTSLSHLSDSGECFLIRFGKGTAIYFFSYRGIIDSSKGYVYTTDEILWSDYINTEKYVPDIDFYEEVRLEENWYFCNT